MSVWDRKMMDDSDFKSYFNTGLIKAMNDCAENFYSACWYAVNNNSLAAPAGSSGWFLSSRRQLAKLYENKAVVEKSFTKVGEPFARNFASGYYWYRSEMDDNDQMIGA